MSLADETPQASVETSSEDAADAKRRKWREFNSRIEKFEGIGKRSLWRLGADDLTRGMEDYRTLAFDLARARAMGREVAGVRHLNGIAVRAHSVLYRRMLSGDVRANAPWAQRFPKAVRSHLAAVGLSALLLFGSAVISFFAIQMHPELGFDLVPPGFMDFQP